MSGAASSSGGGPPKTEGNATLCPHEGVAFVDETAPGAFALTRTLTLERQVLSPGSWSAMYNPEGYGCLVAAAPQGDPAVLPMEEVLDKRLFLKDDGEKVVLDRRPAAGQPQLSLDIMAQRFRHAALELLYGPMRVMTKLQAFVFTWPRQGSKVLISLQSVYSTLGLVSFKSEWSKWAWTGSKRWGRFLVGLGLCGQLVQGPAASVSKVCSADAMRNNDLPTKSVSIGGLVALSLRWSSLNPKMGGLDSPTSRTCALYLLDALVLAASGLGSWDLKVAFVSPWPNRWPRPERLATVVNLVVSSDGAVDLRAWQALAESGASPLERQWWASSQVSLPPGIAGFLAAAAPGDFGEPQLPHQQFTRAIGVAPSLPLGVGRPDGLLEGQVLGVLEGSGGGG